MTSATAAPLEPVIVVPTSDRKKPGGSGSGWLRSFPGLDPKRHQVADAIERYLAGAATATSTSHTRTAARLMRNRNVLDRPTMPAIERYDNTLFSTIGYDALAAETRSMIDRQVLIVSGLWGVLRPRDPIPDYLLPMSSRFPPVGLLEEFWRDDVGKAVNQVVDGRVVWDFLGGGRRSIWASDRNPQHRLHLSVRFRDSNGLDGSERRPGKPVGRPVSDDSQFPRGELVRFIVEHSATSIDDVASFRSSNGWSVDTEASFHNGSIGAVLLTQS